MARGRGGQEEIIDIRHMCEHIKYRKESKLKLSRSVGIVDRSMHNYGRQQEEGVRFFVTSHTSAEDRK